MFTSTVGLWINLKGYKLLKDLLFFAKLFIHILI